MSCAHVLDKAKSGLFSYWMMLSKIKYVCKYRHLSFPTGALVEHVANTYQFQPFQVPSVQEIGGHFLFGYAAALTSRSIKISVITGLMALAIDFDHLMVR